MKIKYLISLAAILGTSLSGCSDFLNADNPSAANKDAEEYFSNDPSQLRATVYSYMRSIVNSIDIQDQSSDLYINPRAGDDGDFHCFTLNTSNGTVQSYYTNCWKIIQNANAWIHYSEAGSKDEAEARFLRNQAYYYLTQMFGAVPYVDWYIQDGKREYPRVAISELYPILIKDLEEIYSSSKLDSQNKDGYVSKQAVAALLAKLYLAYAWDCGTTLSNEAAGTYTVNNTELFNTAAAWAEKAINGVQLTMSFADKWDFNNQGNEEEIWSIQYDREGYTGDKLTGGHSLMYDYMGYYGNCLQVGQKGTGSGGTNNTSLKSLSLWEKGDSRFYATFMTTLYNAPKDDSGNALWTTEGYLAPYNCTEAELSQKMIACIFYPEYMTFAEIEADLASKSSQTKKMETNVYGINEPFALRIGGDKVYRWKFKEDGSLASRETLSPLDDILKNAAAGGLIVRKWDDPKTENVTKSNCYRDIPVHHVSEMYLNAAEAYLLAGNEAKALEKVNAVRTRAGLAALASFGAYDAPYYTSSTFNVNALDLILDERARETYAERTRYFDLRRTKQLVRYMVEFGRYINSPADMQNAKGETKWYRPFPLAEMDLNLAISYDEQNPGY